MLLPKGFYNKTPACQWFANCNTSTEDKPRSNWSSPSSLLQNDEKKGMPLGSYSSNLPLHAAFLRRFSCCLSANGIINETFDVKQILELVGRAAFKHFIFRTKSVWVETPVDQRLPQIFKEREKYSKSIVKLNGLQITASSYVCTRAVELFEWTGKRATVNSWSSSLSYCSWEKLGGRQSWHLFLTLGELCSHWGIIQKAQKEGFWVLEPCGSEQRWGHQHLQSDMLWSPSDRDVMLIEMSESSVRSVALSLRQTVFALWWRISFRQMANRLKYSAEGCVCGWQTDREYYDPR